MATGDIDPASLRLAVEIEIEELRASLEHVPAHERAITLDRVVALEIQLDEVRATDFGPANIVITPDEGLHIISPNEVSNSEESEVVTNDANENHNQLSTQQQEAAKLSSKAEELLQIVKPEERQDCEICLDSQPVSSLIRVSNDCSHLWCQICLRRAFRAAIKNEANYPVVCCTEIDTIDNERRMPNLERVLGLPLLQQINAKAEEYNSTDRTYCHVLSCSAFIPAGSIRVGLELAICPTCQSYTCIHCKKEYHSGKCQGPVKDTELENWCKNNQVSECLSCHRKVELTYGCNHMECHCGTEFCYNCNLPWHTCSCPVWQEDRLLERAADVAALRRQEAAPNNIYNNIDNADNANNANNEDHINRIMEIANELRDQDECRHDTITEKVVASGLNCHVCHKKQGIWAWRCNACERRFCSRCRRDYQTNNNYNYHNNNNNIMNRRMGGFRGVW